MREPAVIIIKKKAKGHAHHGGAWKVAYADFVTAMMALFIVLWITSQTDQETRQQLSEYFRTGVFSGAPSVVMGGSGVSAKGFLDVGTGAIEGEQESLNSSAKQVTAALVAAAATSPELKRLRQQVDVRVTQDGLLIQIMDGGEDVLFDLSSAALKPELRRVLEVVAPILSELENKLQIQGHTDARPFPAGSPRTNWELSFERADNARAVLEKFGVKKSQIAGVFAHADKSLRVADDPMADANRRLAILAVRRGSETLAAKGVKPSPKSNLKPISIPAATEKVAAPPAKL